MLCGTATAHAGDIACSERVVDQSWALLARAQYGFSEREHAAFIVREDDQTLSFVDWPYVAQQAKAQYRGRIPRGTVAIVHTHPNERPVPSPDDVALAQRIALPVYVLTRTEISRTADGRVKTLVVGDWNPERQRAGPLCR